MRRSGFGKPRRRRGIFPRDGRLAQRFAVCEGSAQKTPCPRRSVRPRLRGLVHASLAMMNPTRENRSRDANYSDVWNVPEPGLRRETTPVVTHVLPHGGLKDNPKMR